MAGIGCEGAVAGCPLLWVQELERLVLAWTHSAQLALRPLSGMEPSASPGWSSELEPDFLAAVRARLVWAESAWRRVPLPWW